MRVSTPTLVVLALSWFAVVVITWNRRLWLPFYITGAFGFTLLSALTFDNLQVDEMLEAVQASQVRLIANGIGLPVQIFGMNGLVIPSPEGWSLFDVGLECSGLLEMSVFVGLVAFYPGFLIKRKVVTIAVGVVLTYVINVLRILLIVIIIATFGNAWVFAAHAIIGRVFFFTAATAVYWYLVTRPTLSLVGDNLEKADAGE